MTLTMTDMFCGAGGSSTGAIQVPGITIRLAMNHWDLAIETHNTNHPDADHAQADISAADPRAYPRTDILWASPECTNHSVARGKKRNADSTPDLFGETLPDEAADRSRATMWDVPRFAEHHRYRAIITENVVDAARWELFPAWLHAMDLLGYDHTIVYLNSMHAQAAGLPAPQSRDRMYVVFWLKGNRAPDLNRWTRPAAYCTVCETTVLAMQAWKKPQPWGRYRAQYVWRCPNVSCRNAVVEPSLLPASSAIDWSIQGERIGDRDRPLAAKTMARIQAGLDKFCADPFLHIQRGEFRNRSAAEPLPTLVAAPNSVGVVAPFIATMRGQSGCHPATDPLTSISAGGGHHGLLVPVEGRDGKVATFTAEPMRTMTTRNETALVVPLRTHGTAAPVTEPLKTIVAGNVGQAFVVPMRANNVPKLVEQPYDTFAANGNHHGLALAQSISIEDCQFRMLSPAEIALGMAFTPGYTLLGTKREQVRLAGNAVTPPAARDLVSAVAESLGVTG